jgi:hypothetical protein
MKRKLFLLVLVFTVVLLTGCHFIPDEELYNNTNGDIIITTYTLLSDQTYEALKNDQSTSEARNRINKVQIQMGNYTYHYDLEDTFTLKTDQSTAIGVPYKIKIQIGNQTYYYDITWMPYQFWDAIGGNRRLAKLQIQEDGSIYLLLPKSTTPVTNFPPQPINYPLKPKTS